MKTSQSDVDKVMAAFGAAPIAYRPNQDLAARADAETRAESTGGRGVSSFVVPPAPAALSSERILPGAGGRVREIFPLLWRAIPVVGDLKIGAIKRPGDEVPEASEPETSDDRQLAARIQAASETLAPAPAATPTGRGVPPGVAAPAAPMAIVPTDAAAAAAAQPAPRPVTVNAATAAGPAKAAGIWPFLARGEAPRAAAPPAADLSPVQWEQPRRAFAEGPAAPSPLQPIAAGPAAPHPSTPAADPLFPPLRSHADLVRPIVRQPSAAEAAPAVSAAPLRAEPGAPQPAAPPPAAPSPAAPLPAAPQAPVLQPAPLQPVDLRPPPYPPTAYPPPPPPGYPYYPPQGMPPYPMHPAAMAWPPPPMAQPGLPSPGYPPFYGPAYAPPAPAYPAYPPYSPGYAPPYPYGYAPPPGPPGAPPPGAPAAQGTEPYPRAPQLPPTAETPAARPPQPAPPTSLSDIFAALHRAPDSRRGEGTPP
jgi:hypothetical protein